MSLPSNQIQSLFLPKLLESKSPVLLTDLENELMVTRREGLGGGIDREFGIVHVHTAIFKIGNQQGPTL